MKSVEIRPHDIELVVRYRYIDRNCTVYRTQSVQQEKVAQFIRSNYPLQQSKNNLRTHCKKPSLSLSLSLYLSLTLRTSSTKHFPPLILSRGRG
jgi:hypothetical protein